jgi:hypothetical protein
VGWVVCYEETCRVQREKTDNAYIAAFRATLVRLYPSCPESVATTVTEHACEKHSGRVGRSAAAKELDAEAIHLAVRAHIRHEMTNYDYLLSCGHQRREARELVKEDIEAVLANWRKPPT